MPTGSMTDAKKLTQANNQELTSTGKQILAELLKTYPPGPCRDRLIHGKWVNCDECGEGECIRQKEGNANG